MRGLLALLVAANLLFFAWAQGWLVSVLPTLDEHWLIPRLRGFDGGVGIEIRVQDDPVVLARDGKLFEGVLRRELVSRDDFRESLRMNGIEDVSDVELALLETNGSISVVKKRDD